MNQIQEIYKILKKAYGLQGWWPLVSHNGVNPTKTGSVSGYHPGDYSFPRNSQERFEICCGAILTQNTGWVSVEKALLNLQKLDVLSVKGVLSVGDDVLKEAIKPAGYFNQKAKKLKLFAKFFQGLGGRVPGRDELLSVWGIGPETADSILLYGYSEAVFVIDAYTKRVFSRMGICDVDIGYDKLQKVFMGGLGSDVQVFNEYHALLVEHAKRSCKTKPECASCVLGKLCEKNI